MTACTVRRVVRPLARRVARGARVPSRPLRSSGARSEESQGPQRRGLRAAARWRLRRRGSVSSSAPFEVRDASFAGLPLRFRRDVLSTARERAGAAVGATTDADEDATGGGFGAKVRGAVAQWVEEVARKTSVIATDVAATVCPPEGDALDVVRVECEEVRVHERSESEVGVLSWDSFSVAVGATPLVRSGAFRKAGRRVVFSNERGRPKMVTTRLRERRSLVPR